tara:strand:- start:732 stop:986 length:255 start_codon:yes stop_codon:yes gene_type:complete
MKQFVKLSEARILMFLDNAERRFKYAGFITHKLNIEYNFLILRLKEMRMKGWIQRVHTSNKVFYTVTTIAPMKAAKKVLENGSK